MADSGYDGSVRINTKIDERGFNTGVAKMVGNFRKSAAAMGNVLKKALTAGLLVFALSISTVLRSVGDSLKELISIRGDTLSEDVEAIKGKFTELRASIAAAFLPLIEAAIPYIKMALDWLIQLFNRVAMITAAFLGQREVLQVVAGSAAKFAKNTKDAEKAARGALAAFDQIDVLQRDKQDTTRTVDANLVPVTDDILAKVKSIKDEIAAWWADPLGKLQELWGKIKDWFRENVINPIKQWWNDLWKDISPIEAAKTVLAGIMSAWGVLPMWIYNNVILPVVKFFRDNWEIIRAGAASALFGIFGVWAAAKVWFLENVINPIRNGFDIALNWIGEKFRTVFEGVRNFAYNTLNKILAFINEVINSILAGINAVLSAASSVSGAFSAPAAGAGISGAIGGLLGSIRIPRLATGTVIPPNSQFLAMVGDNKREEEVVSPLSTIRQAVLEAMSGSEQAINLTVEVDGEILFRTFKRVERRHGTSLIAGGVTG